MNFELTAEQQQFRDAVRGFAERHLRAGALDARAPRRTPVGCRQADGRTGPDGHHHAGRGRRPGRHADGRDHRDRNRRLGLPAQRRRDPGRQLRPGARARRVRHAGPEDSAISTSMLAGEGGDLRRHDRTRSGLRGDRSQDHARRPTATGYRINGVKVFQHACPVRRRDADLRALRPRRRRHRLGADPARCRTASSRASRRSSSTARSGCRPTSTTSTSAPRT